jgi:site-specific DNA recombinase
MQERFFEPGAFAEFCAGFTEEMNRLRREHRTKLAAAPREIAGIKRRAQEILRFLFEGYRNQEWKDELRRLDERRAELEATLATAETEPPLPALHPHIGEVFRQKTMQLAAALEQADEQQREAARQSLRGFIDRVVIPPRDGLLQVVGNLGEMLTAAGGRNGSAAVGYVGCGGGI